MSDQDNNPIFVVIGRARWNKVDPSGGEPVAVMLRAADDDDAVRRTLDALAGEGYVGTELDKVGIVDGRPSEPPYDEAFDDAVTGDVSIVRLR